MPKGAAPGCQSADRATLLPNSCKGDLRLIVAEHLKTATHDDQDEDIEQKGPQGGRAGRAERTKAQLSEEEHEARKTANDVDNHAGAYGVCGDAEKFFLGTRGLPCMSCAPESICHTTNTMQHARHLQERARLQRYRKHPTRTMRTQHASPVQWNKRQAALKH